MKRTSGITSVVTTTDFIILAGCIFSSKHGCGKRSRLRQRKQDLSHNKWSMRRGFWQSATQSQLRCNSDALDMHNDQYEKKKRKQVQVLLQLCFTINCLHFFISLIQNLPKNAAKYLIWRIKLWVEPREHKTVNFSTGLNLNIYSLGVGFNLQYRKKHSSKEKIVC